MQRTSCVCSQFHALFFIWRGDSLKRFKMVPFVTKCGIILNMQAFYQPSFSRLIPLHIKPLCMVLMTDLWWWQPCKHHVSVYLEDMFFTFVNHISFHHSDVLVCSITRQSLYRERLNELQGDSKLHQGFLCSVASKVSMRLAGFQRRSRIFEIYCRCRQTSRVMPFGSVCAEYWWYWCVCCVSGLCRIGS